MVPLISEVNKGSDFGTWSKVLESSNRLSSSAVLSKFLLGVDFEVGTAGFFLLSSSIFLLLGGLVLANPGIRSSNPLLPWLSSSATTGFFFSPAGGGIIPNPPSRSSSSTATDPFLSSARGLPASPPSKSSYEECCGAERGLLLTNTSSYTGPAVPAPNTSSPSYRVAEDAELVGLSPGTAEKMSSSSNAGLLLAAAAEDDDGAGGLNESNSESRDGLDAAAEAGAGTGTGAPKRSS